MKNPNKTTGAKSTGAKGASDFIFKVTIEASKANTGQNFVLLDSFTMPFKSDTEIKQAAGMLIFAAKVAAHNEMRARQTKACLYYTSKNGETKTAKIGVNDILLTIEFSSDGTQYASSAVMHRLPLCIADDKAARQHMHARNIVESIVSPLTAEINKERLLSADAAYFEEKGYEEYTDKKGNVKKRAVVPSAFRIADRTEIYKQHKTVSTLS